MRSVLLAILIALTGCVAPSEPTKPTGPYVEDNVVRIVKHNKTGGEFRVFTPRDGLITVHPEGDTISFTDQDGSLVILEPSYSVEFK